MSGRDGHLRQRVVSKESSRSSKNDADRGSSPKRRVDALSEPEDASKNASSLPLALVACLIGVRVSGALRNHIEDCDETFNYWEPTHFLQHGYGLQTWEYSPEYAIRSWSYAGIHAALAVLFDSLTLGIFDKRATFYFVRVALALFSAASEIYLSQKTAALYGRETGTTLLSLLVGSAGMFGAAPAYLPSSFAMTTTAFAFATSLESPSASRTMRSVLWFALGTIVGWPFAGALAIPFAVEDMLLRFGDSTRIGERFLRLVQAGIMAVLLILVPVIVVDSFFYRKFVVVPLQIVLYNVFGGDLGPALYGTEPWWYYSANLVLNFNVTYLLAAGSLVLVMSEHLLQTSPPRTPPASLTVAKLCSFYLWTAIFTAQPHKEERFMFVVYPLLCFNAALSLSSASRVLQRFLGSRFGRLAVLAAVVGSSGLSMARVIGLHRYYSAPMDIYRTLGRTVGERSSFGNASVSVCVGKEWHRFPSHYFLPELEHPGGTTKVRLRFLRSSFGGLLPKDWVEDAPEQPWRRGTFLIPTGMNNRNQEETDRYVDPNSCDYVVDLHLPSAPIDPRDPEYVSMQTRWRKVQCLPFLDKDRTQSIARILWVPGLGSRRVWGEYCLLERGDVV